MTFQTWIKRVRYLARQAGWDLADLEYDWETAHAEDESPEVAVETAVRNLYFQAYTLDFYGCISDAAPGL